MTRIALYPGSFDPLTNGHINIIRRGLKIFDRIIVAVAVNVHKKPLFDIEERLDILRTEFSDTEAVVLDTFSNTLLVDYATQRGATVILRGLRTVSDFDYEIQMTSMNRKLNRQVETLFMVGDDTCFYISSSLVKEVASLGGDVSSSVPDHVARRLQARYNPSADGNP